MYKKKAWTMNSTYKLLIKKLKKSLNHLENLFVGDRIID